MKIYNSISRKKESFVPSKPKYVSMYVCGPTVYNYFHIGNARPFLFFDVVRRYFRYIGWEVKYVQNITDIEDKLIEQAEAENTPVSEIAQKYTKAFFEDIASLGIEKADHHTYATEFVLEMIQLIQALENKGVAYEKDGDVYFSVAKVEGYGKLSGKKLDQLMVGARIEANSNKDNPADFTLWKKMKPGEPYWNSPWGKGRPGWHTECVVMSKKLLGQPFDIHGGGIDLIFPHHENERAQALALNQKPLARFWMHNGYLNIEGEKMSKSKNNFLIARDILKHYSPEAIRYFFLSKHYRSPIDFNEEIIKESETAVKSLYESLADINYYDFQDEKKEYDDSLIQVKQKFIDAMNDDFNTAIATSQLFILHKIVKNEKLRLKMRKNAAHLMVELGSVLGFFSDKKHLQRPRQSDMDEKLIALLISYRAEFKQQKNWEMADRIRDDLKKIGVVLMDTPDGTKWKVEIK